MPIDSSISGSGRSASCKFVFIVIALWVVVKILHARLAIFQGDEIGMPDKYRFVSLPCSHVAVISRC
jgi:hypothetical protein